MVEKRNTIYSVRNVQDLLGYDDVKTTMIYTYVLDCGPTGVKSLTDEP
jgi:site-specific recombinase XerC